MQKIIKTFILSILLIFVLISGSFADNEKVLTEKQIREIVIDVIKNNPKIIYEVLTKYIQQRREKQQLAEAFNHRISGIPIYSYNPTIGPKNAPITIIEFTDFQCPFCRRASDTMDKLMKIYPGKIRLVFRNLPLSSIHKESFSAAKAAMAAHKQGMFWPYHDMLFDNAPKLNKQLYIKLAKILKLDIDKFKADMDSQQIRKEVQEDINIAKKFGINATPIFIINGVMIRGAKPLDFFRKVIDTLLKEAQNKSK